MNNPARRGGLGIAATVISALCLLVVLWTLQAGPNDHTGQDLKRRAAQESNSKEVLQRIDCFPEAEYGIEELTEESCESRGCVYDPLDEEDPAPDCYVPQDDDFGYSVISGPHDTELGQRWYLERLTDWGIYGENLQYLTFDIETTSDNMLRFKLDATDDPTRYKVPLEMNMGTTKARQPAYRVEVQENPFSFQVIRESTNTVLFDTSVGGLAFTDQFLQIATLLPSPNVYGLGENLHQSFKHDLNFRTWPLFTRDQPPWDPGSEPGVFKEYNLYSVHPFYEVVEDEENAHGVFFLNSNAMDYTLTPAPMLVYKTIGGILDFYMFMGPTPENVIQQYTETIGRPFMPPYWALGFQQSRYGFVNLDHMQAAVNRTIAYDIPLDVIVGDIDYMDKQRIFTIDPINYVGLPEWFDHLRSTGKRTIVILDPCVEINDTYVTYTRGADLDVYIKWPDQESMPPGDWEEYNRLDMMGYVWPEWKVVFPDFYKTETADWWRTEITEFISTLAFDGLWLDMNEAANFDTNKEKPWNWPEDRLPYWSLNCTSPDKWDHPPYRTKAAYMHDDPEENWKEFISAKTLCMRGVQDDGQLLQYDVHSLYGATQSEVTLPILQDAVGNKRSMIVTRSTFAGTGKYAGRWLGDNAANWEDLHLSIIGMLEFNLFGIPYIGADICGFFGDSNAALCRRWQELGAFYTFSRNHNDKNADDQDPGYYGDEVAIPTRNSLRIRYTILPYLYTLFHRAHTRGDTVIRSLMHEFPSDTNSWDIDRQFLWGPAFLITAILEPDATELAYYLPPGRWYDYYTSESVTDEGGENVNMEVDNDTPIQLHIRGGFILPTQQPANSTFYSRQNPMGLKVALDNPDGYASGELFWDDGDSIDTFENGDYYFALYEAENNELKIEVQYNNGVPEVAQLVMDTVEVMGVETPVSFVYVDDVEHTDFTYDENTQVLFISDLQIPLANDATIEWRSAKKATADLYDRLDCCPEYCTQAECLAKGCLYEEQDGVHGVPWCYINHDQYGYDFVSTSAGITTITWKGQSSMFGDDIDEVHFRSTEYDHILQVRLYDPAVQRYEVPIPLNLAPNQGPEFDVNIKTTPTFGFDVLRLSNNAPLWDTQRGGLTFSDQFLQVHTKVNSDRIYGFGEHLHPTLKHGMDYKTWPFFSRDQPPSPDGNLYSVHPFYLCVENDGKAHGVLFWNSNAMEVVMHPTPGITYRTTGGIIDVYFIIGDSPEEVIQRYTQMIGLPMLPAYWSLGFHISRYGYNHLDNMRDAVERTQDANIPLDVIHMDIDTFDESKDFTYDRVNFDGLPDYIAELQEDGMRAILILDPCLVSNESNYRPYDLGLERDVFVYWPEGTSPDYDINGNDILLGFVWPRGRVVFPDFFKPETFAYWKELIVDYHDEMPFDGIWLDMNEPANFDTNQNRSWNWPEDDYPYWTLKCPTSSLDDPAYKPMSIWGDRLSDKTICMVAMHNDSKVNHYDVHSLYGWSQNAATEAAIFEATGQRGSIITRSTFPSSGKKSGHWLGDNASIWPHLRDSVIGMIEFNLFGIPFVGADICGYFDDCPAALCQRWQQLGSFYPFARNHNGLNYRDQDPGAYTASVAASSRKAMEIRYTLLPYLYTLFYHANTQGSTVVRPVFFEFALDDKTYDNGEQFLWGPAFLVSPVMREGKSEVYAYFPIARWFDYYNGAEVTEVNRKLLLTAPSDHIPLHIRGGYILPTQQPAPNTRESRQQPFGLIIAPDSSNAATGDLFWDDGQSIGTVESDAYCTVQFSYLNENVSATITKKGSADLDNLIMDTIRAFGVPWLPTVINIVPPRPDIRFTYNEDTKELFIENLNFPMDEDFSVSWSQV